MQRGTHPLIPAKPIAALWILLSSTLNQPRSAKSVLARFCCLLSMAAFSQVALAQPAPAPSHPTVSQRAFLTFGVSPFLPPTHLDQAYGPLLQLISANLGIPVQLRTRASYAEFSAAVRAQQFDMALLDPLYYADIRTSTGYQPMVSRKERFAAQIIVIDAELQTLADLRGKTLGAPSPAAAVTRMGLQYLTEHQLYPDAITIRHFGDHLACKQALISRRVDACISQALARHKMLTEHDHKLRALADTETVPGGVIVLHNSKQEYFAQLQTFFAQLNSSDAGRAALEHTYLDDLILADPREYETLARRYQTPESTLASPPLELQ